MRMSALACLLLLTLPAPAPAGDGRIEINQARAEAGGITPGDLPGFPVSITEPGSYVLTGDLTVAELDVDGIQIAASGVTIDLNGFSVVGSRTCTGEGSGVVCTPTTTTGGWGISSGPDHEIIVRDGTVRGFWNGISLGGSGIVAGVVSKGNQNAGLVGENSPAVSGTLVLRSQLHANGLAGMAIRSETLISATVIRGNKTYGAAASFTSSGEPVGAILSATSIERTGTDGLWTVSRSPILVSNSTLELNEGDGLNLGSCSLTIESVSSENGVYQLDLSTASGAAGSTNSVYRTSPSSTGLVSGTTKLGDNLCDGAPCP